MPIQAIQRSISKYVYRAVNEYAQVRDWKKKGCPAPPPHLIKQQTVKAYARKFSLKTLVETGTFMGEMVNATKTVFSRIISIELDKTLYDRAQKKFSDFAHITIVQGDSGKVLPSILANITSPCLFWLDGHYSEGITARGELDTPILKELEFILSHPVDKHVVLIDDARCFDGSGDYPTIEELQALVWSKRPRWKIQTKDDIIRILG